MRCLESRLNAIWYAGRPAPRLLRLLSGIYAVLLALRTSASPEKLAVPVVVVGNFTVGGTGKTPVIIALVDYLKSIGYVPGVVSRGYGRSGSAPLSLDDDSTAIGAGDEPLLIFRRCHVPVRVDADRRRAAEYLAAVGCNIIVSDDGLQHRNLPRSLEIEIIDAARGYGNRLLLPAGPLRERPRVVDMRIGNGYIEDGSGIFSMQLRALHCRNLVSGETRPLADFSGEWVNAIAGIGNPQRFFDMLSQAGVLVSGRAFADHYRFAESDLPEGTVLMTEKDATKFVRPGRDDLWAVVVDAQLSQAFYSQFDRLLHAYGEHRA